MKTAPAGYKPIVLLPGVFDVAPLRDALDTYPGLWNQRTERTAAPESPHHEIDDIWVRSPDEAGSDWYPDADVLPVRPIAHALMTGLQGERLGGILITRIPPGAQCRPHVDPGWHARHFDKFAVQIASAPGQGFHFDGHTLEAKPGEVYWFDNAFTHWVTNESAEPRITLIVCIRTERTRRHDSV